MARHDFEEILDQIKTIVSDNFNTKLTAITTEKGDSIVLPTVDASAYFIQSLDAREMNFDPAIVYGIENIEVSSEGPMVAEKIFVYVAIILSDNGRDDINRIMYRYSRAFKEIFQENWQIPATSSKLMVNSTTVVPFTALDSSATYKAVGVELEVNLAS